MNETVESGSMSESGGMSRRGLLRILGGREVKPVPLPDIPLPKPPWARDNRSFLALCDRCNLCRDVCPERVIRPLASPDQVLNGIAVLSLDYGQCTFCGQCVDVCPTGALDRELGQKIQARAKVSGQCARALGTPCDICADSCPEQAISLEDRAEPFIDNERCSGCGECALSCYSRALTIVVVR